MTIKILQPQHPRLKSYIEYYWTLQADKAKDGDHPLLTPETCFDVVLSFDANTNWETISGSNKKVNGSFVCGIRHRAAVSKCLGSVDYFAIRFRPLAVHKFFRFMPKDISDQVVELDVLSDQFWTIISEKLAGTLNDQMRVNVLERELIIQLEKTKVRDTRLLEHVLSYLHSKSSPLAISQVTKKFDVYPKRLEREFKQYIGVTPKFYSRIVRFNHALAKICSTSHIDWHDVVYNNGFYDQAHFIREMKHFSGLTPKQLHAKTFQK